MRQILAEIYVPTTLPHVQPRLAREMQTSIQIAKGRNIV